jgi:hypothetical protein
VVELRHYTLHPHQRDVLIELFEREFIESQEEVGMKIIGQFRRPDAPDRFVWLRGFPDMSSRAESLQGFYYGPVWQAHRSVANATMIDSDNVLLLRPARPASGFSLAQAERAPRGSNGMGHSVVLSTIYRLSAPAGDDFIEFFERDIAPVARAHGASVLAYFVNETAKNTFPALPVREGENAFVWFAQFQDQAAADRCEKALVQSQSWGASADALAKRSIAAPEVFRLSPTARSLVR